jgi:hypothetical protein
MDEGRAKQLTEALPVGAEALYEIARTAVRNKKAISGTGSYADKFHDAIVKLTGVERLILPVIETIPGFDSTPLRQHLATVKSLHGNMLARDQARKQVRLICETEVLPQLTSLATPVQPTAEPVLAVAVLGPNASTYSRRTLLQANGCYTNRWFDASSVMIRKLVESLIIDVYEHGGKQTEITDKDGSYFMLSGLVMAIANQTHWSLQRETKQSLPALKKIGDRAAHNRRYEATRQDIDSLLTGLRSVADDFAHLAGYK